MIPSVAYVHSIFGYHMNLGSIFRVAGVTRALRGLPVLAVGQFSLGNFKGGILFQSISLSSRNDFFLDNDFREILTFRRY